jgi:hypothetical protein
MYDFVHMYVCTVVINAILKNYELKNDFTCVHVYIHVRTYMHTCTLNM